jgi:hypothetical protein
MKIRKIFEVKVRGQVYDVYDLEDKKHQSLNGEPETWWLYFADRLPEGTLPPIDSDNWTPWDKSILRMCWEFKIKQVNSVKNKWDEWRFSNRTIVEMYCNDVLVYEFSTLGTSMDYALAKIQYLQVQMSEHCYNFFQPKENQGRKIYWYGLPATVNVKQCGYEIGIIPDYTAGLTKEEWWKEYKSRKTKIPAYKDPHLMYPDDNEDEDDENESMHSDYINWVDALSDYHIDWFRN